MHLNTNILEDNYKRQHNYLRISLTERCNLRCTYCMPSEGVVLSPKSHLMTADEVFEIAKIFVANGVDKIRLTGGEPLVRKDFVSILKKLNTLNVKLCLTSNGILVDKFIDYFKRYHLKTINISLDSLKTEKFFHITKRNQFKKAYDNIKLLLNHGFGVKLNVVLIKNFNDDEIIDFIELTKYKNLSVRFIEFMPFRGNYWDKSKLVSQNEILHVTKQHYNTTLLKIENQQNFTSRDYKIIGYQGDFGIISTITNPFCDNCNRIRLTANGKIKNCLFSTSETDILSAFRTGQSILPLIENALHNKKAIRSGMHNNKRFYDKDFHKENRSMLTIGG